MSFACSLSPVATITLRDCLHAAVSMSRYVKEIKGNCSQQFVAGLQGKSDYRGPVKRKLTVQDQ